VSEREGERGREREREGEREREREREKERDLLVAKETSTTNRDLPVGCHSSLASIEEPQRGSGTEETAWRT
jgi:hypothetical protein